MNSIGEQQPELLIALQLVKDLRDISRDPQFTRQFERVLIHRPTVNPIRELRIPDKEPKLRPRNIFPNCAPIASNPVACIAIDIGEDIIGESL